VLLISDVTGSSELGNYNGIFFSSSNPIIDVLISSNVISGNYGHGIFTVSPMTNSKKHDWSGQDRNVSGALLRCTSNIVHDNQQCHIEQCISGNEFQRPLLPNNIHEQ